jgi:putative transposase
VSRAGFYRYLRTQDSCDEEMQVRSEIQRIALAHRGRYGYRRMTTELRRRGMLVNHKRIARIMREDSLIGTQMQSSCAPSESQGHEEIYINLAHRMRLTGANQLWVADITFIRLKREFVSLAVLLDSRERWLAGIWIER